MNKCENCDGMLVFKVDDFQALVGDIYDTGVEKSNKELEANKKLIAELTERLSDVNDWLNSDSIFTNYKDIENFRLITKGERL